MNLRKDHSHEHVYVAWANVCGADKNAPGGLLVFSKGREHPQFAVYHCPHVLLLCCCIQQTLPIMDVSVRAIVTGAVNCDTHCEMQSSVNQEGLEREPRCQSIPGNLLSSESERSCQERRCCACLEQIKGDSTTLRCASLWCSCTSTNAEVNQVGIPGCANRVTRACTEVDPPAEFKHISKRRKGN